MTRLSIGKRRGLQQCATSSGGLSILALDHRNNLRSLLGQSADGSSTQALIDFKREVVNALGQAASGILLDPEFGAAQAIASDVLPGQRGLIVALEATGYTGNPFERESRILEGWSIEKAKRMGSSAVKLLVYYHPDSSTAPAIESLVRYVADECMKWDMLLILEPLSYSLLPGQAKLESGERRRVVIETAQRLTPLGGDILKAEFPGDAFGSVTEWESACRELSAASRVPWVLLSASVDFATYMRQVEIACHTGASGVAAGRAVWQEALTLSGRERQQFLLTTAYQRMAQLTTLCDTIATPWTVAYEGETIEEGWYERY